MATSTIIKKLHQKNPSLKYSQIKSIFEIIFDSISNGLISNKPIEIRGFGRLSIKSIKAKYNAINPKTLEKIYVPKKKKVSFKMSKHLKEEKNKKL